MAWPAVWQRRQPGKLLNLSDIEIIIDCELNGADTVLKNINSYPSNRTAVVFAIISEVDVRDGLPAGAEQARRMLYAASGLLIREYRRYFRCGLEVPVHLVSESKELRAKTTNISIGGLAIRTLEEIRLAEKFRLKFELPIRPASKLMENWFGQTLKGELDCDS